MKKKKFKFGDKVQVPMLSGGWKDGVIIKVIEDKEEPFFLQLKGEQVCWAAESDLKAGWKRK